MVLTPEAAEIGVGDLKDERLKRAMAQLSKAFDLAKLPAPAEVFDARFLPPLAERRLVMK